MGYIKVQTVCLVIIAIAAVKYLLPDIRKLCRIIGGEERKKVEKPFEIWYYVKGVRNHE